MQKLYCHPTMVYACLSSNCQNHNSWWLCWQSICLLSIDFEKLSWLCSPMSHGHNRSTPFCTICLVHGQHQKQECKAYLQAMKKWKTLLFMGLKVSITLSCIVGFFFNSIAILQSFVDKSTTVTSNTETVKDGFKAPSVTICGSLPFKGQMKNEITYEAYDDDSLLKREVIKNILRWSSAGSFVKPKFTIDGLYTSVKGKCFIIKFQENVSLTIVRETMRAIFDTSCFSR